MSRFRYRYTHVYMYCMYVQTIPTSFHAPNSLADMLKFNLCNGAPMAHMPPVQTRLSTSARYGTLPRTHTSLRTGRHRLQEKAHTAPNADRTPCRDGGIFVSRSMARQPQNPADTLASSCSLRASSSRGRATGEPGPGVAGQPPPDAAWRALTRFSTRCPHPAGLHAKP